MRSYTQTDFYKATQILNTILKEKQPKTFDPQWIECQDGDLYKCLSRYFRTETGTVDWDAITVKQAADALKKWLEEIHHINPMGLAMAEIKNNPTTN